MQTKKVTMQQIADQVGVSKFAVFQALSGKSGIGAETRAKIIQTATLLGYFTQKNSRSKIKVLSQTEPNKKTDVSKKSVIVLMPNVRSQNRESHYWGSVLDGVTSTLDEYGVSVMVVTEHNSDSFLSIINPQSILGLIGIGMIDSPLLLEIRNAGIQFVLVDHEDPLILSDTIFMNSFDCMRMVTGHLIGLGHHKLQFVGDIQKSRSFYDRWLGYRTILEERGLKIEQNSTLLALPGDFKKTVSEVLKPLAAKGELPSAFVCANDNYAYCLLEVLSSMDVKVPENCSVTGFDGEKRGTQSILSTVNVPERLLGKRAVEVFFRRLDFPDEPLEKTMIYGDFMIRKSIAPYNANS